MRRYALLLMLLLWQVTGQVHAAGFANGDWEAEDANVTYVGVWSTNTSGFQITKSTTSLTAHADFTLDESICTLWVGASSTAASGFSVNIGVNSYSITGNSGAVYGIIIDTSWMTSDQAVSINLNSAGTLIFDRFRALQCEGANTPYPTATILPSSTPANTPVPTATILPSSTPFIPVPTATILPSSTPANTPVNTPTEINTPVDTPTAIVFPPTPTEISIDAILTALALPTNTPGPSLTPSSTTTATGTALAPWVYITVTSGQLTRFDFTATASDVHIANLLTLLLFSAWGFFLFGAFVVWKAKR